MQDVQGKIRETMFENGWSNGTEKNIVASAKTLSPIACTAKELEKVSISSTHGFRAFANTYTSRSEYSIFLPRTPSSQLLSTSLRAGLKVALARSASSPPLIQGLQCVT
jgi:hypothetical protein